LSRYKVGLTGGLASGKSTVARWLADAGFLVADADRLVAELYLPGGKGAAALAKLYGPGVLDVTGAVDKLAIAQKIFSDPDARREVEAAIHPLVRERFAELATRTEGVAVYEATLLAESGHARDFDLIVTVEAPEALRLERAIARGLSEEQARARLVAQGDGAARRAAADRVIDNSAGLPELRVQVDALIEDLRRATFPIPAARTE
jgi:dephospho-CoA kinase